MIQSLSHKYAKAFMGVLGEQECLKLLQKKQEIVECFKNQDFREFIENPFIGEKEKVIVFNELLRFPKGKILDAISVLTASKRLILLPEVLREMEATIMRRGQKYYATIFFNGRLSDEEMNIFKKNLSQKIGYEVELRERIWNQEGIKCYVEGLDLEILFSSQSFVESLESFILDTFKKGV